MHLVWITLSMSIVETIDASNLTGPIMTEMVKGWDTPTQQKRVTG